MTVVELTHLFGIWFTCFALGFGFGFKLQAFVRFVNSST